MFSGSRSLFSGEEDPSFLQYCNYQNNENERAVKTEQGKRSDAPE